LSQAAAKSQPSAYSRYDQERFRGKEGEPFQSHGNPCNVSVFILLSQEEIVKGEQNSLHARLFICSIEMARYKSNYTSLYNSHPNPLTNYVNMLAFGSKR